MFAFVELEEQTLDVNEYKAQLQKIQTKQINQNEIVVSIQQEKFF